MELLKKIKPTALRDQHALLGTVNWGAEINPIFTEDELLAGDRSVVMRRVYAYIPATLFRSKYAALICPTFIVIGKEYQEYKLSLDELRSGKPEYPICECEGLHDPGLGNYLRIIFENGMETPWLSYDGAKTIMVLLPVDDVEPMDLEAFWDF